MAATNAKAPVTKNESFHCPVRSRRNPEENKRNNTSRHVYIPINIILVASAVPS